MRQFVSEIVKLFLREVLPLRKVIIHSSSFPLDPYFAATALRNVLSPYASNSIQNATGSIPTTNLVRVTHPFHPQCGQQLLCVGERFNRYGRRVLLELEDGTVCSVPPQWTDLAAPEPMVVIGEGRAYFCLTDLMNLAKLVARFKGRCTTESSDEV